MSEEPDVIKIPISKPSPRVLEDWITTFMEYTAGLPSPELYRKWVGYCIISGAMERRVWTEAGGRYLYPNLAVLLIGRPGVGKTFAIDEARKLWTKTGLLNVAQSGMTKAAFIDHLIEKVRHYEYENNFYLSNSMCIASNEFGVLMPSYDRPFVNTFNEVFDCKDDYDERTRGGGMKSAQRPHVCMIAGTQPKYLGDILPDVAWEQGFMARVMMVYQSREITIDIFDAPAQPPDMHRDLLADLISVANLIGKVRWETGAKKAIEHMNRNKKEGAPEHPKLTDYVTRRVFQCMKVSMVLAVSKSNSMIVKEEHVETAMVTF